MAVNLYQLVSTLPTRSNGHDGHGARTGKKRLGVSDLPFADWNVDSRNWRTQFVPSLLAWAGTQRDPFGTKRQMDDEVTAIWQRIYPAIVLDDSRKLSVLRVCENTLNNWRSDIGKAGHRAIVKLLHTGDPRFDTTEGRAEYIAEQRDDLRYIYKYPDATIGRGAFCSPLVSVVYSTHLRKINSAAERYGPQIGAIALATTAVERGLTIFKSGEDALKADREVVNIRSRYTKGLGFVDNPWGEKARQIGRSTSRLNDKHWDMINEHAYAHIGVVGDDSEEVIAGPNNDADDAASNPHAFIDLSW